jgi:hypothetical protein
VLAGDNEQEGIIVLSRMNHRQFGSNPRLTVVAEALLDKARIKAKFSRSCELSSTLDILGVKGQNAAKSVA